MAEAPLLSTLDLGRRVEGSWLWRHVSFDLCAGEIGVLRGRSGAGKSLLFRALVSLDLPDEGEVRLSGNPVSEYPPPTLRSRVMYCPQRPLLIPGTVRENLALPQRFAVHGAGGAGSRPGPASGEALLSRLGKDTAFIDRRHDVLSGGEGQLVSLVRALLLDPTVLLLDEPTAGLDEATALLVEDLVSEWVSDGDRAVMWTSHDARQTRRVGRGPSLDLGGVT